MSDPFTKWLQTRLTYHGFACDPDGWLGAKTRRQLAAFQKAKSLKGTGTATAETVVALRRQRDGQDSGPANVTLRPIWLAELERRKGLHEVRDYSILAKWLWSDGKTLGDPRLLPWCGDAVQTAIALTLPEEPQITNPYLARNWMKFGRPVTPRLGSVMVFWRGSKVGPDGHVALYVGEDATAYHVIGGNQSNAITETRIAKERLLGARWPVTDSMDTFAVTMTANGVISTNEA